jgi:uncharacterized protein YqeY
MLIDEIKKANMQALKDHDTVARAALSVLVSKYMLFNIENRKDGKETTDAEVVSLIQKFIKELEEEKEMYVQGERAESVKEMDHQLEVVNKFLPQMMSEDDIKKIIGGLTDKSIKNVMTVFKTKYAGKVDMTLVAKLAKSTN